MPLAIRLTRITNQPPEKPDYEVRSGNWSIGRIYEDRTTPMESQRWFWSLYGMMADGISKRCGRAATLEQAKAELRENWSKWLAWAKLAELPPDT